jgi:hypothetical protein
VPPYPRCPEPAEHAAHLIVTARQLWPGVPLLQAQGDLMPTTAATLLGRLESEFAEDPWALDLFELDSDLDGVVSGVPLDGLLAGAPRGAL